MSRASNASDSSSDESLPRESLVAGRAKRTTAGNRLSHLLQHLDDEDIKADLLAEDEDDQQDYSASDEGDVGLGSSSEDEDEDNEAFNLAGEKELKRQERQESNKKRKARDLARTQPMSKRVKIRPRAGLAPVAVAGQLKHPKTHKNVLERATALQIPHEAVRQSARSQTIASAKVTEEKLKDHYKRAVKAQELMKIAADKKAADARPALTQADRMARALEIEQENSQSLNLWEHHEKERQRSQKEKLEAIRNRKISGPFVRYWSGPVMWRWRQGLDGPIRETMDYKIEPLPSTIEVLDKTRNDDKVTALPMTSMTDGRTKDVGRTSATETITKIEDAIADADPEHSKSESPDRQNVFVPLPSMPPYIHHPPSAMTAEQAAHEASIAKLPVHKAKATRNLIILESFPTLDNLPQSTGLRRTTTTTTSVTAAINKMVLPDAHPDMTPEQRRYMTARMKPLPKIRDSLSATGRQYTRKADHADYSLLPPAPTHPTCVISGKIAKYRDPQTGLYYHDRQGWIGIWRALNGGAQWSVLLGAWSGIVGSGPMGRVAAGVPEAFWTGVEGKEGVVPEV